MAGGYSQHNIGQRGAAISRNVLLRFLRLHYARSSCCPHRIISWMSSSSLTSAELSSHYNITTSMFETFIGSQDELALVLGHEISHLGYSSERNSLETSFRTIEILLLSLDPTEGLLSLACMTFLASVRNAIGTVHSRDHERCADELGMKLTAMDCYDTRAASQVF